jgi:hypothetical protein
VGWVIDYVDVGLEEDRAGREEREAIAGRSVEPSVGPICLPLLPSGKLPPLFHIFQLFLE